MIPGIHIQNSNTVSRRAFTLVELLTVIAIIGILAAITMVGFSRARAAADQTKCTSNLRNVATAGLMWIGEHKNSMPDAMFWRTTNVNDAGSFLPYMGHTPGQSPISDSPTLFSCPASFRDVGPNSDWNRGYSINIYACRTENGVWPPVSPYNRQAANINQIARPALMAFLMDANILADGTPERKVYNSNTGTVWKQLGASGLYAGHPGGTTNVALLDGHVKAMNPLTEFPTGNSVEQRLDPFWGSLQ
jgi:prepilin-type N-terminal cleavage/methylation domain-containing protein/prepilin-type processing-associated H-X9-DG protein